MDNDQTHLLYFAYGEHMNECEMKRLFPMARMVGMARLPGLRLCFVGQDGMARAGALRDPNGSLPGRVWSLPVEWADALSRAAGESIRTSREIRTIHIGEMELPALVFVSLPGQRHGRPSLIAYDLLREAYETAGENPEEIRGYAMQCAPLKTVYSSLA